VYSTRRKIKAMADVYEGSPIAVTAFLSVISKGAMAFIFLRVLYTVFPNIEPAWYALLDPSLGSLKYQYAQVTNPKARVYVSLQDATAKNGNFGYLPNYPAYVAYTTTETSDGRID